MRITDAALQQVLRSYKPSGASSDKAQRGTSSAGASRGDEISISPEGQSLQRIVRAAQEAGDIRADRVAELQTKLRTGEYELNPQLIANRMLGLGGA